MDRFTQIICTLGPASSSEAMLEKMASRGMNVARINASHGTEKERQHLINTVRSLNKKKKYSVGILLDLQGYRIRVGELKRKRLLTPHDVITMSRDQEEKESHVPFDFTEDVASIKRGMSVFIDDGQLHLKVLGHTGNKLKLKVVQGGVLKENKGINIPDLKLKSNIMTEEDKQSIQFGIENHVDFIAESFVRNKKDIQRVVDIVKPRLPGCRIVAKIENYEGLRNLDGIIDACDGIMVARGDLGVSLPIYKIPMVQKYIIRLCSRKKKFAITATQMLDNMIENGRPTRAEVSDIANAILDGTDYVMLSGETAVGKYPSRSIQVMRQIIEYTEKYENFKP